LISANKAVDGENIKINLTVNDTGNYSINGSSIQIIYYRKESVFFMADSISQGDLLITKLDTINKIVSCTFYFDAVNDTIRYQIRNGRFDLKY
jgi:hypothetical protein